MRSFLEIPTPPVCVIQTNLSFGFKFPLREILARLVSRLIIGDGSLLFFSNQSVSPRQILALGSSSHLAKFWRVWSVIVGDR